MTLKLYSLPELKYDLSALEPVISKEIMELHYHKHHQGYVNKLNDAIQKLDEAEKQNDLHSILLLQNLIAFNGGGHYNHSLFWSCLTPKKNARLPQDGLLKQMTKDFGSYEKFLEKFSSEAAAIQGSGWCFLAYNLITNHLQIISVTNHQVLSKDYIPMLIVDVWEHAYYLQYKNDRAGFIKNFITIIDWETIEKRFNSRELFKIN
jgi:Fe-Mn family superoxide dismutase